METANAYIPMDWRQAMARGERLPEQQIGAALMADLSGFTPITEAFTRELGPKRGGEELTKQLNLVYDRFIGELHRFGGSVIGFSGDAITCWFNADHDGRQAVTCALALQRAMSELAEVRTFSGQTFTLSLKVGVAIGTVRRFLVGLAEHRLIDTMAGDPIDRIATAETLANPGEVIIDANVVDQLESYLDLLEWRVDEESGDRYAVIGGLNLSLSPSPWPEMENEQSTFTSELQEPWLLPAIFRRLLRGEGEFLTQLRPAVALFVRFAGLDYDQDPEAPHKLNRFVQSVQQTFMRFDGSMLQLTIGDKGSYLYGAFGAPIAHEDDIRRALTAALEINTLSTQYEFLEPLQIGIAAGIMRVGAYGGTQRRTYGVLGDMVNLSARLMSSAPPGHIYVNSLVYETEGEWFTWEQLPPLQVKGKTESIAAYRLITTRLQRGLGLLEPNYQFPMVGRQDELTLIADKIEQALQGAGQIIGISAEAGMGKSRLAAEAVALAQKRGFDGYGGECQSYGMNTSYQVWQTVWRRFFDLNPEEESAAQLQKLEAELTAINPSFVARLPLLAPVVNLSIPDNDLTASLDAKIKKSSLESLLVECLRHRANTFPILIVLEDAHWLDSLSKDLITEVGRIIPQIPVLLLLIYRPPDAQGEQLPTVVNLPHFTEIPLNDFSEAEAKSLIQLKLEQFYQESDIPDHFIELVIGKAAGNPFYIEEILNFVQDLNINPHDEEALTDVDLPNSIYSLILSRIDQLNHRQQITIRVASVIGRLFRAAMIWGIYPQLGESQEIRQDLDHLSELELTVLEKPAPPAPELVYFFKQVITQQVAYESLPYDTRARLHEQIGGYIEEAMGDEAAQNVDILAFHYDRSNNEEKKRHYLLAAGQAAHEQYANTAAINYYQRVLPLVSGEEQANTRFRLAEVYDHLGQFDRAHELYLQTLAEIDALADKRPVLQAKIRINLGILRRKQSEKDEALSWLEEASTISAAADDQSGLANALVASGTMAAQSGEFDQALDLYEQALAIRQQINERTGAANILNNMGIVARFQGNYPRSRAIHENALGIRREINHKWGVANSLNNLGNVSLDELDYKNAQQFLQEALEINREIGDKWHIANGLNNLGNVLREQGQPVQAARLYDESVTLNLEMGDKWALAYLFEDVGSLMGQQNQHETALILVAAADNLRQEIQSPLSAAEKSKLDTKLAEARELISAERQAELATEGERLSLEVAVRFTQNEIRSKILNQR